MRRFAVLLLFFQFFFASFVFAEEAMERANRTGALRWGGDAAGGAPYVFPDPNHPEHMIGFEVDIMERLCERLGIKSAFVNIPWDQLVPALLRGDFDLAFNGLEITKDRLQSIQFSIPYYFFSEQLTIRAEEMHIIGLDDLRGRPVGTLSASLAQNILETENKSSVVPYPSPVEAYRDLEIGRVDAVLMDVPIAAWYASQNPKLRNLPGLVGEGVYAAGIRKDSPQLKRVLDRALKEMILSGELEAIYKKWNMWNVRQEKLKNTTDEQKKPVREQIPIKKFTPLLLKGAGMTIILSLLSMLIAIAIGFLLCVGKLYGSRGTRLVCNAYIEVIRGTPLLIQLYLLYYGLPNIGIQLNAFTAAILGLGFNYAAYEAEIYRAGLLSIPKGQEEAARSLGMSGRQSLRFIILPQAIRTILPPSTNDFIALFKDTSLVSIITVVELTRAYGQAATTTYRFLDLGLLTALLYFLMSFPLSILSRAMEKSRQK